MSEQGVFEPSDRAEWRAWLRTHGGTERGVWLVLHKGRGADPSYEDAVEEAVAFGWIDSKGKKLDEQRYKLWMGPRKPGSGWAISNKERVARLTESGQMAEPGLAVVQAAKADGSWTRLDSAMALEVPVDLAAALDADPVARANFDAFPPSARRIILEWISLAKLAETRARRISETARLAAENIRANQ